MATQKWNDPEGYENDPEGFENNKNKIEDDSASPSAPNSALSERRVRGRRHGNFWEQSRVRGQILVDNLRM